MIRAKTADVDGETVKLDALPDVADFRDRLFVPSLVEAPTRIDLDHFKAHAVPVRHQGYEGSCTGFALSTVAHFLLRRRQTDPDSVLVSARMFYEMAKRYDEWPGEAYEGSSARGAMKAWQKHGVCSESLWSYAAGLVDRELTNERSSNALTRPLGAYFRVNHKDLVAMHTAIAEVGVLFVTAVIHGGWFSPDADGFIMPAAGDAGGHAFAIVGYNQYGFWIQNSWGSGWGIDGCALLTYDDWLNNAMDVWVARLGVPVQVRTASGTATALSGVAGNTQPQPLDNVRSYIISVGDDGRLRSTGVYATTKADIARIFEEEIPGRSYGWKRKRLLLYAHSGLASERKQLERILELASLVEPREVFLLAFHWHSGFLDRIEAVLRAALAHRKPEGVAFDRANEFMLDRLDDALEPLVRSLSGKLLWDDLKGKGVLATRNRQGAGRIFLDHLLRFLDADPDFDLHIVAHSAGSPFLAPLIQLMTGAPGKKLAAGPMQGRSGHGLTVKSCTLWAPATTLDEFRAAYLPAIESRQIERCNVLTLTDEAERADQVGGIYHKSLLYLISHALGAQPNIPLISPGGDPLLGLARDLGGGDHPQDHIFSQDVGNLEWGVAPNSLATDMRGASAARSHFAFETDRATIMSTLRRMDTDEDG